MPYKAECKFRSLLNFCRFNEYDCNPVKCNMYNIKFEPKSLKEEIKKINEEIKVLVKKNISLRKFKKMLKLEQKDKNNPVVIQYKKNLVKIQDLNQGLKFMETAYRYCKRTEKSFTHINPQQ